MSKVLAVGRYDDISNQAIEDEGWTFLPSMKQAMDLDEAARNKIEAIAYIGHHAFGGDLMDLFPNLGLIANNGVGYDAIDVDAASQRNIKITNTPDVLSDDVADLTVAMLLAQLRSLSRAEQHVRSGAWDQKQPFPLQRKMSGGKVGIIGLGRIGREIADRFAAFKMEIHYWSRKSKDTPDSWIYHENALDMMGAVDFAVVALVGGPATEDFVTKEMIEALGPRGILVNISRGTTVDENAMIEALQDGRLGGACLDVFRNEPHADKRFYDMENVVLQPHQASATVETRAAMGKLQRDNVKAFIAGQPLLTPVN
ncbi:D-isomer specific 2-hydroxyacid dehydrogenase family protein [Fulvimarina pelagi HTCC2506]|uniref:D-isomer specific 2-hydroxyacid dehydrogenase family protein n=1 Tax=Fulvimarina pelagi HTCC2506 TaxID=314231 RepID=Q0G715_9HYPH|nr:2-hydroxyacid dehydrogenase [Fulvimarina pelagi]EAU42549.1 D-isomer specific 2-hydroxyacid dehydrogenase family protein [Fulvimarina pelagi HTCC2506]